MFVASVMKQLSNYFETDLKLQEVTGPFRSVVASITYCAVDLLPLKLLVMKLISSRRNVYVPDP